MQPQAYNRSIDFTDRTGDDTDHGSINKEFDAAAASINGTRLNLALIQRDDGALKNKIVTADSLDESALDLFKDSANAAAEEAKTDANYAKLYRDSAIESSRSASLYAETALAAKNASDNIYKEVNSLSISASKSNGDAHDSRVVAINKAEEASRYANAAAASADRAASIRNPISSLSLSNGSCEFTGLTGYSRYRLIIDGLTFSGSPDTGGFAKIHIGTGATPTYITSGYGKREQGGGSDGDYSSSGSNLSEIMGVMPCPFDQLPSNMVGMVICDFSGMGAAGMVLASFNAMVSNGASDAVSQTIGSAALNVASAPTAIKISGNLYTITGGTASLYGIPT